MPTKPARVGKWEPGFHPGVFVGMLTSSSEAVVVTEQGSAIKTRVANVRRIPESERRARTECSECEQFRGLRTAVTIRHSSQNGEARGDGASSLERSFDGEQSWEDVR